MMKQFTTEFVPEHGLPIQNQLTGRQLAAALAVSFESLATLCAEEGGVEIGEEIPVSREQTTAALEPFGLKPVKPYRERLRCVADFDSFCEWIGKDPAVIWEQAQTADGSSIDRGRPMQEAELHAAYAVIGDPNVFLEVAFREATAAANDLVDLRNDLIHLRGQHLRSTEMTLGRDIRELLELEMAVEGMEILPQLELPEAMTSADVGPNPQLFLARIEDEYVLLNEEQLKDFQEATEDAPDIPDATGPGFEFPSTDVYENRRRVIAGLGEVDWRERGLLAVTGYRVGRTNGIRRSARRKLLNFLFLKDDLHDVDDPAYAAEWGAPMTGRRLRKLAESIAAFTRNAKRRHAHNMTFAIADWEDDLDYLKRTFYDGWGDFPWPHVSV